MESIKPFPTPISTTTKLDADLNGEKVDETTYSGMVGSLMYLTTSRPDIVFDVSLYARAQSDPRASHLVNIKKIPCYLKGSNNLCLWYPKDGSISLVGYTDADYAGYLVDRKSTSGMAQFLGPSLVSWGSRKQNSTSTSTTEVEYIGNGLMCILCSVLKIPPRR
ncbi:uncharacterized protein [Phyllobates terribilis]|uniref:uncharacterized protein n=1 Tax=Phyllobates terribilis TaxID=111132 RepID=UPI003CCA9FAA